MSSAPENTVSRCSTESAHATHSFEIIGYTLQKGIGVGNFVQSGTFTVGGYDWAIRFYPDGYGEVYKEYVAISLHLISSNAHVRALHSISLVNQVSGSEYSVFSAPAPRMFKTSPETPVGFVHCALMERNKLEQDSFGCIVDDCLTIQCDLTVAMDTRVWKPKGGSMEIPVPPSDLSEHLRNLWLEEATSDVVFVVQGTALPAHKLLLAACSPVFKAELLGQMREGTDRRVPVEDMRPDVFRALLHFAYTDDLPESEWDDMDEAQYCEIVRSLLVAADRYAMDRLKQMCASILQQFLAVENVATTLAFADHNNCESLREACIEFMASTEYMDGVVATQGYADLKMNNPSILVDVLEMTRKFRK